MRHVDIDGGYSQVLDVEDEVALDEFSKFEEKLAKKQAKAKDMG